MVRLIAGIVGILASSSLTAVAACSAGAPLLDFQLAVEQTADAAPRSVRDVNALRADEKLIYAAVSGRAGTEVKGSVSLVLVPADPGKEVVVLEPHPAVSFATWEVPFRTEVVALVYGPAGLDVNKVRGLIRRDSELITQLADYAEQTTRTEQLLEALAEPDAGPTRTENVNAALLGFSASYGRQLPRLDTNAPPDQQFALMLRAINPALSTYDPLAPRSSQRMQQSAILASSVAGLFLGNPVGLAAGGAAMFVNLGDMLFPDTEFRSAFVQQSDPVSMTLCAKRRTHKSRTRLAYLWAVRVPNLDPPAITLAEKAHLPVGAVSKIPIRLGEPAGWPHLGRALDWKLVGEKAATPIPIRARPNERALELDLRNAHLSPGIYRLAASWDRRPFEVDGQVEIHPLLEGVPELTPASKDLLVQGSGPVTLSLRGCDFQFVKKVELLSGDTGGPQGLDIRRPPAAQSGKQETLDVIVDTSDLKAGSHTMSLVMAGDHRRDIPLAVHPPHPTLTALPWRVHTGDAGQMFPLQGEQLERVVRLECDIAGLTLKDGGVAIALHNSAKRGDRADLMVHVDEIGAPVRIPDAILVIGPRPRITQARVSLPGELGVELRAGELPAGSFVSFSLQVEPLEGRPELSLDCVEQELVSDRKKVLLGSQTQSMRLRSAGANTLFLSLDPESVGQHGCTITAVVSTEEQGASHAHRLGQIVRLPRIDRFELSSEAAGNSAYVATLSGEDLELIKAVGWSATDSLPVDNLPAPVAAGGHKQSLQVTLTWPSPEPHAPLFIWLRGETQGRQTTARY